MERFHWVQHRCQQLLAGDSGWRFAPTSLDSRSSQHRDSGKRRTVFARHGPHQEDYEAVCKNFRTNAIRTNKYSLLTFIPMNLFQQFHRAANLYFLFLALLNWVPVVEAFQKEITMIPLVVVLTVIAIKDAVEDYRRYLFDKKVNNKVVRLFCGTQKAYIDQCWSNVRVGDFVRLSCNEIIPADILLLYSSDPRGVCYIETANLDGETNLKQRQVVSDLPVQGEEFTPENFRSRIECENPNNDLSRFRGYIEHSSGTRVGLHSNNLLLRSCTVRNTETVVGIVIYAGHETKAMMNNTGPRYKRSKLEKQLNTDVLWCVFLLIIMCLTAAIGHGMWLKNLKDPVFQVDGATSPAMAGFYTFWTMIIVLQVLIPISLYVSIEIVKLGQIFFIQNDLALYNEQLDTRILCRALNITEDLGQIRYLFSDKTGTLTENKMVFRRCSIYGVEYPHAENGRRLEMYEAEKKDASNCSVTLKSNCSGKSLSCRSLNCNRNSVSLHTLTSESAEEDEQSPSHIQHRTGSFCSRMEKEVTPDPELVRKLNWFCSSVRHLSDCSSETLPNLELTYIADFFLALAICNSVVVSSPSQPRHVVPETQSPLKSLEEIKLMFQQRFSFSPLSALSPAQIKASPYNLTRRLFTRGKTGSFTFSSPPNNITDRSNPDKDSNLAPSIIKGEPKSSAKNAEQMEKDDTGNNFIDIETNPDGVEQGEENLATQVGPEGDNDDELLYEAESPDEAALVHAARAYRCTLKARSAESLLVDLPGIGTLAVQLLHILPFDTNRKRMSVVVRHPLTGQLVVYTKGADSVIMDLSETPSGAEQTLEIYSRIREQTQKHLDAYAREGLRTLCFAKKVLKEEEYDMWLMSHLLAESSIENREELLLESAQRLETNLTLLGTTGIVDRLQEEVPETIEALQRAGIKVWILTGDKQETAINIAYACNLLCANDQILTANCNSMDACEVLLEELKLEVQCGEDGLTELTDTSGATSDGMTGFILVIDGQTLEWALEEELKSNFLELSCRCKAVICCRSTPLQKSKVVKLIRDHISIMTLAVGDGANDVNMIQTADVGIGIAGQEGMQAVMSSDFAITRFKHLSRLLLVHGHWCYTRLSNMIFYFIYKNVMYVNLLFWYQFFCGFSGSVMTDSWVLIFFNLLFTSVPPLIYGILDRDTPAETLMEVPEIYHATQTSKVYVSMFWITVLDAFYQSLVCFFVPYFAFAGSDAGQLSFGSPINSSALLIILLHQVIESNTLTWIHVLVLVFSAGSYFGFVLLFSVYCVTCSSPTSTLGVETFQMSQPLFYIICVLTTVTALIPRLFFRAVQNTWIPNLKSSQMDRVDVERYHRRMQQWNQANRLPVYTNNPGLAPSVV